MHSKITVNPGILDTRRLLKEIFTALVGLWTHLLQILGGSDSKESVCNAGDLGSIPGLGRSPGVGNGNPCQYSCLEDSLDREAWRATIHEASKCQT